jgi:hypothetical protein
MTNTARLGASFRDPSGFIFRRDGIIYRQVNQFCQNDYDLLMKSGLYDSLVQDGLLVSHAESAIEPEEPALAYRVIKPQQIPFISYPYEWCFSQLKDAALLTLAIQERALQKGLSLKDASAYNVQFLDNKPIFIDTLSFEAFKPAPWVAYRQFCQHFLAPLALMVHRDIRLAQLLTTNIDGIPLDLASALLPGSTKFNPGLLTHLHMHASLQSKYGDQDVHNQTQARQMTLMQAQGIIESLKSTVTGLKWAVKGTEWGDYYDHTNYTQAAFQAKEAIVSAFLAHCAPQRVWDLGANNGVFSRLAAKNGALTVSADLDPLAVESNYLQARREGTPNLLPLVVDLTNPSPAIGWENKERESFYARGPVDVVMALALVHHLAISNNLPLAQIAATFSHLAEWLIIEFIPKTDSQVQRLLQNREDIFPDYHQAGFETAFRGFFSFEEVKPVEGSQRIMYLMKRSG